MPHETDMPSTQSSQASFISRLTTTGHLRNHKKVNEFKACYRLIIQVKHRNRIIQRKNKLSAEIQQISEIL